MDIFQQFMAAAALASGGRNEGAAVPVDDTTDVLQHGAKHVPFEVTDARRRGERVVYHPERQVWIMPGGKEVR